MQASPKCQLAVGARIPATNFSQVSIGYWCNAKENERRQKEGEEETKGGGADLGLERKKHKRKRRWVLTRTCLRAARGLAGITKRRGEGRPGLAPRKKREGEQRRGRKKRRQKKNRKRLPSLPDTLQKLKTLQSKTKPSPDDRAHDQKPSEKCTGSKLELQKRRLNRRAFCCRLRAIKTVGFQGQKILPTTPDLLSKVHSRQPSEQKKLSPNNASLSRTNAGDWWGAFRTVSEYCSVRVSRVGLSTK